MIFGEFNFDFVGNIKSDQYPTIQTKNTIVNCDIEQYRVSLKGNSDWHLTIGYLKFDNGEIEVFCTGYSEKTPEVLHRLKNGLRIGVHGFKYHMLGGCYKDKYMIELSQAKVNKKTPDYSNLYKATFEQLYKGANLTEKYLKDFFEYIPYGKRVKFFPSAQGRRSYLLCFIDDKTEIAIEEIAIEIYILTRIAPLFYRYGEEVIKKIHKFTNGDRYEGQWKDGKMNGQGIYYYNDGSHYDGQWEDGKKSGQGTLWKFVGSVDEPLYQMEYEGKWENDQRNGQGTFWYANGDCYVGEWKNDQRNGQGTCYYTNGDRYKGWWRDDQRNGQGTFFVMWEDAKKDSQEELLKLVDEDLYLEYEGEWKDGKMNGQGKYYYGDGHCYEGEWKDGKMNGQGKYYYYCGDDDDISYYEGEWRDGQKNGQGMFWYANGDRYEGEWRDDQRNGQGTYHFSNKSRYIGQWKNDEPSSPFQSSI